MRVGNFRVCDVVVFAAFKIVCACKAFALDKTRMVVSGGTCLSVTLSLAFWLGLPRFALLRGTRRVSTPTCVLVFSEKPEFTLVDSHVFAYKGAVLVDAAKDLINSVGSSVPGTNRLLRYCDWGNGLLKPHPHFGFTGMFGAATFAAQRTRFFHESMMHLGVRGLFTLKNCTNGAAVYPQSTLRAPMHDAVAFMTFHT